MEHKKNYVTQKIQLIDTPGLLDRPLEKRNTIEKQAIAALRFLADVIILMSDPSESCGYSLTDQQQLRQQINELYPQIPLIEIENKVDAFQSSSKNLKISCKDGTNIDKVKQQIIDVLFDKDS
jgi:nucleolar GTP-binding protein